MLKLTEEQNVQFYFALQPHHTGGWRQGLVFLDFHNAHSVPLTGVTYNVTSPLGGNKYELIFLKLKLNFISVQCTHVYCLITKFASPNSNKLLEMFFLLRASKNTSHSSRALKGGFVFSQSDAMRHIYRKSSKINTIIIKDEIKLSLNQTADQ